MVSTVNPIRPASRDSARDYQLMVGPGVPAGPWYFYRILTNTMETRERAPDNEVENGFKKRVVNF